jgi:oligopeptide transport system substrate-binding protein
MNCSIPKWGANVFMIQNSIFSKFQKGLIILAVILPLASGCTSKTKTDPSKTFHGFKKDDVKTWDPANAYDTISLDLVPSIYETLYQYSYLTETYQLEPLLASDMPKYSSDRLTITIPIKKGIRFQDDPCFKVTQGKGRELKAQDFVYSLKRLASPSIQSSGWWILDGKITGINTFHDRLVKASKEERTKIFEEEIEGIKAVDDHTLQLKLTQPYPQLLYSLAMSFTAPVPREAVEAYGDSNGNLTDHPVGTGPFQLKKWNRNQEILLVRNPNFRDENYPTKASPKFDQAGLLGSAGQKIPMIEEIHHQIIKEDQPRWLNFLSGKADVINIPKDNFKQAMLDADHLSPEFIKKGIHFHAESGNVIRYISFNMKDKVLGSNTYLRQALSSAVNRDQWIAIFTNGTGKKMSNLVPPGLNDRPKTDQIKYDFNLLKAKELLKKAGYPNGEGLPVLKFDLRGASTTDRQLGDFFAQQFSQIGVRIEVIPNTFPAFLEKWKQGNLQISMGGWSLDYPDPENIYQLLYGPNQTPGPGESNFDHPEFNQLYKDIKVLDPGIKRAQKLQRMDDIAQEECPWALGYYETTYDLAQPWLSNYRPSDIIQNKYKYYKIIKH